MCCRSSRRRWQRHLLIECRSAWQAVLLLFMITAAGGCALGTPSRTATVQPYKRYVPAPDSLFQLQFEYPSTWYLGSSPEYPTRIDLSLGEASSLTPSSEMEVSPDRPLVGLTAVRIDRSSFSIDQEIDDYLAVFRGGQFSAILADERAEVDGHPARTITLRIEPPRARGNLTMLSETIFLLVDDRYYQLGMQIPEHTQQGAFAQGFRHLIDSIKIIR